MTLDTAPTSAHALLGDDVLLTADQVADELRVTVRTVERWRSLGSGPKWRKIGPRRIAYRVGDVRAFIQGAAA